MNDRTKLLESFNQPLEDGKVAILLLSLKAGGVGLNLTTAASRAYMMDPWWSPSMKTKQLIEFIELAKTRLLKLFDSLWKTVLKPKC